ncbi:MAG: NUDIX domain-containing protein [Micromonosporaceae bacterium]
MTSEQPLYLRDPEAWQAHLAEGNARQARKRVGADVIIRDTAGRILLVDPVYKPDWDLPGGMAEANEPPRDAATREVGEELGLGLPIGPLLCIDWVSPHGPWDDLLSFVFDGGTLHPGQLAQITLRDTELSAYEFCSADEARQRLRRYVWRRAVAALDAVDTGRVRYLHDGHLPTPG